MLDAWGRFYHAISVSNNNLSLYTTSQSTNTLDSGSYVGDSSDDYYGEVIGCSSTEDPTPSFLQH